MNNNKNILITGGAGFIGSHIADELITQGFNVSIIDNLSTGKIENINDKAIFYKADIVIDDLNNIFEKEKPSIVIHLAAQVSVSNANKNPAYDAKENIIGTLNILEYCKKYNTDKMIAASSAAVYGEQEVPIKEDVILQPMSNYGLSKLTMEKYIQLSGVPYIICRFSNVYGERQNAFGEAGVVSIFSDAMLNNKDVFIDGDGEQSRDFVYVKDIANLIYKLCSSDIKNEILNVSTNTSCTINELFKTMANVYGYKKEPIYREARIGDIKESILSNSKVNYILNNKFIYTNIENGLSKITNITKLQMIK